MLKIPAFRSFPKYGVTAYQDDTMFWKFYLVPDRVSIRRDQNGNPVFLLIKYAFGDQDREENKDLPRGGGYMVFDTEMKIADADYTQITAELQQDVDQIWRQLKALAESAGQSVRGAGLGSWHHLGGVSSSVSLRVSDVTLGLGPDRPEAPPGDRPPRIITDFPTWTAGTFHLSAPQSKNLVSHRLAEGPVSLTGNNVVAANLDLTSAGATFMEKTLTDLDGGGGADLTPIQIRYELKFWARVPPCKITATADARSLYMSIKSIYHDYEGNGCDEDSMTHSEHYMKMAIESGLVKVVVDTGGLPLEDDFKQELITNAQNMVMSFMKERFFEKKPAPPPADDPTKDFVNKDADIYYMKTEAEMNFAHFRYDLTISGIVEWKINPQGTLQTFLAGVPPQEMKKYVRVVDLDDDFFKTLQLTVTAFADWANEPIAFVEMQVRYTGVDENNRKVEKVQTFTFTKDHTTEFWDPSLIGAKREYQYRWRMAYLGKEPTEFTKWQSTTTPKLNLSIGNVGKIVLQVLAGNIDFGQVTKSAQVDLSYSDPGSQAQEESVTVALTSSAQDRTYQRYIYTPWDRPVRYRTRFFLKNDQVVESDWMETTNRQLLINEPNTINRLDVQMVPVGDWSNVLRTTVNVRYADSHNSVFADAVFDLKAVDEFRTWSVILKDPNLRKFQYKLLASFKDGSAPYQTDWLSMEGDQALPITVKQAPRMNIRVMPNLVDFKITPVVTATLRYDDPQGKVRKVDTLVFTEAKEQTWAFPIVTDGHRAYRKQVTYNTALGRDIRTPEVSVEDTVMVLDMTDVPAVAVEVQPKLVNFAETPVVEVNVSYRDEDNDIDYEDTLVFTGPEPQKFRVQIEKDSPKEYGIGVTYYLADGRIAKRDPVNLDKSKIVIPRYVPGS